MSNVVEQLQNFLAQACKEPVSMSDDIVEEFGELCKSALRKQFTEEREKKFRIRMSNIGRPICQLQMEKLHQDSDFEEMSYNSKLRNMFGDIIEIIVYAMMKSANVNIESYQKKVKYKVHDELEMSGSTDVEIDGKVYDIKSASPFSYDKKFGKDGGGFQKVADEDVFGYLSQGYLYAEALEKPFGGWIVINKSTGEIQLTAPPSDDSKYRDKALQIAKDNVSHLLENKPFKRCFEDEEETFRQVKTGNRKLGLICSFCNFKKPCWGDDLQFLPQQQSKARNPKWFWYTKVTQPKEDSNVEG